MVNKLKLNIFKNASINLLIFYLIYQPRISEYYLGVRTEIFIISLVFLIGSYLLAKRKIQHSVMAISKHVMWLFIGIMISILYLLVITTINNTDPRIIQNFSIIWNLLAVMIIVELLRISGYTARTMLVKLFSVASWQGYIAIGMIIFPSFRQVAYNLYYLGREENIFISQMRIYGISGDYTFFTPIFQSILLSVGLLYTLFLDKKPLKYLPFILISIILNGRFGILIISVCLLIVIIHFSLQTDIVHILKLALVSIMSTFLLLFFVKVMNPKTFEWITSGFNEITTFISTGALKGNLSLMLGSHLNAPNGLHFIFGQGHRIYGSNGVLYGYHPSDNGYVNDLFLGGLLYVVILYSTILSYILTRNKKIVGSLSNDRIVFNKLVSIVLATSLLLANYKGEVFRGGLIVIGSILIKMIIMVDND